MWESRPLPTSFKKPFAAKARRAFCRSVARYSFHLAQPYSFLFPMLFIWAASGGQGFVLARVFGLVARLNGMCPAGIAAFLFMLIWPPPAGADGGLLGAAAPPRPPLHSPRTTPLGLSSFRDSTRAARLSLRELPRCARRSPSAPRNASARLRVAWEIDQDVSSGRVHCILMEDKCDYSWCSA